MSDPPDSPVQDPDGWADVRCILDEEIAALPEPQRQAVVLCDLEGATRREAASRLGIGDGTLSHRLNKAHGQLARRLSSRGIVLSVSAVAGMLASHAHAAPLPSALVASAVSGLISENALALYSILVKSMAMSKLKMLAVAVACALMLGVGGVVATARPPVPEKSPEPGGPKSAATLLKAHVEGRLWFIDGVDADKKTLDLGQQPAMGFFNVVKVGPGGQVEVQLPPGTLKGLPVDAPVVTVNGKPAKLADLKKGMVVMLEAAPGKAAVRRVAAYPAPVGEVYTLKGINKKGRTVKLSSAERKVTLDDVPLAKDVKVMSYKAEPINGGMGGAGVFALGPPEPMPATLDDLKPGTDVSVEIAFEGGQLVVKKLSFEKK